MVLSLLEYDACIKLVLYVLFESEKALHISAGKKWEKQTTIYTLLRFFSVGRLQTNI